MLAGTDVLRFNFNYDSVEENLRQLKSAEKIRADLHAQVKYLADLPDNRIWFGDFSPAPLVLQEGQKITLKSGDHSDNPEQFIPVNLEKLGEKKPHALAGGLAEFRLHQTLGCIVMM